mgnify:FL=1|jgi:hypothetical protein|tara:strand:+ start:277 stop:771 length:495 start_codon:yes stop_codon:yes gene_type:complete
MQSENSGINRSSYSPNAAKQVQPILDRLLETGKDVYVSSQETGFTPNTLYVKFNDGFKFIVDNFDDNKYVILRSRIAFRKLDNGILAYFKDVIKNRMTLRELEYEFNDSIRWKNDLETWYKIAKDSELFERSVAINPDDKEWIYNLVGSDSEVEVTESKVRVMK